MLSWLTMVGQPIVAKAHGDDHYDESDDGKFPSQPFSSVTNLLQKTELSPYQAQDPPPAHPCVAVAV